MSLRTKLISILIASSLLIVITGIVVSSLELNTSGKQALEEKSEAILSRMEAVRSYVASQSFLDNLSQDMKEKYPDGDIPPSEKEKILDLVPIVASWRIGEKNAEQDHYKFKVVTTQPRNPEHRANEKEEQFLNRFASEGDKTIAHIDDESNSLWVMRPVFLDGSQGCMKCHGEPSRSPWGNGKDILGYDMENWETGDLRGMFMIISDMEPVQKSVNSAILSISGWGIVIAVLAIFISLIVIRKIVNVIHQIIGVSENVANGDLTSTVNIQSNDELGDLAKHINKMTGALNQILLKVNSTTESLALSTKEISSNANMISDGAQGQAAQFEELTASVDSTAESTSQADSIIKDASKNAGITGESMKSSKQAMQKIQESSDKIVEAVNLIEDIAAQTNLLAINAGIEASRAGTYGKGFAVVATEIKQLANKSAESAKEISEVIKQNRQYIEQGVELSNDASDKITQIVEGVNSTAEELQQINLASGEQSEAMKKNTDITNSNASSAEELAAASDSLAKQAEQLKEMVSKFKLKEE